MITRGEFIGHHTEDTIDVLKARVELVEYIEWLESWVTCSRFLRNDLDVKRCELGINGDC